MAGSTPLKGRGDPSSLEVTLDLALDGVTATLLASAPMPVSVVAFVGKTWMDRRLGCGRRALAFCAAWLGVARKTHSTGGHRFAHCKHCASAGDTAHFLRQHANHPYRLI